MINRIIKECNVYIIFYDSVSQTNHINAFVTKGDICQIYIKYSQNKSS